MNALTSLNPCCPVCLIRFESPVGFQPQPTTEYVDPEALQALVEPYRVECEACRRTYTVRFYKEQEW